VSRCKWILGLAVGLCDRPVQVLFLRCGSRSLQADHNDGTRAARTLKLAGQPLIGVVGAPFEALRADLAMRSPVTASPPDPEWRGVRLATYPRGHGDGQAPLQFLAMVDVSRQVPPLGYLGEVQGPGSSRSRPCKGLG